MKDNASLLIAGIICAVCAWMFWYFFGSDAADVMVVIALLMVMADNFRLRKLLRKQKSAT